MDELINQNSPPDVQEALQEWIESEEEKYWQSCEEEYMNYYSSHKEEIEQNYNCWEGWIQSEEAKNICPVRS